MDIDLQKCVFNDQSEEEKGSSTAISSKAIVKYSVNNPFSFAQLKCNTNLNLPPSRWLNNLDATYGMQRPPFVSPLGFSSFRMGNMFPDCVGDLDVVSSAENIKKLLKMPYSLHNVISLMVHRVGNTLLIDDFDIHKYLLKNKINEDWKWLRSFISEKIMNSLSEHDRQLLLKGHGQNLLQDGGTTLMTKFLSHSSLPEEEVKEVDEASSLSAEKQFAPSPPLLIQGPVLPDPKFEETVSDPNSSRKYNRNVLWTFEDIRMLIGTDMPIFGGGRRPCISLRLRDVKEPINVLTGIDYWLDNLMCNVPEVLMCYHLDGIVQKYELVKTEDLPNLENSNFSPKVIKNVAQNILAFLKQNATKAGHTYWLFKGPKDDVVKLYDLTTLCAGKNDQEMGEKPKEDAENNNKDKNPFTVPVGMLLYTVARNMKMCRDKLSSKQAGSVKALLENCIKLLPKEEYPQIVTSSHYMLSDLFVPTGLDPSSPNFAACEDDSDSMYEDFDDEGGGEDDEEDEEDFFDSDSLVNNMNIVSIQNIQQNIDHNGKRNWKHNTRPPALDGTLEKRCQESLEHISNGLKCLKYFQTKSEEETQKEKKDRIMKEEQNLNMARPYQPIPLPYESLKPERLILDSQTHTESDKAKGKSKKSKKHNMDLEMSTSQFLKETSTVVKSWDVHLKLLLLEKACLCYSTLAENSYSTEKYGVSLRYISLALNCQKAVVHHLTSLQFQKSCLWGRAGDCYFQFVKNFNQIAEFKVAFNVMSEVDKDIMKEIQDSIQLVDDKQEILDPMEDIEKLLVTSRTCYETAISLSKNSTLVELLRRLANIQNELGMKYMYDAQEVFNQLAPNSKLKKEHRKLIENSTLCFKFGFGTFEKFDDVVNHALVASNMGRLYRLQAHVALRELDGFLKLDVCGEFYNLACSFYEKALTSLGSKKMNATLWEMITWELSTATYTISKLFFESKNDSKEGVDKLVGLLQTGLKYCDMDPQNPRCDDYSLRSGEIHFMLAGVHENSLQMPLDNEKKKRSLVHLCLLHYDKSLLVYEKLDRPFELLNVASFKIEFVSVLIQQNTGTGPKLKCLSNLFDVIDILVTFLGRNLDQDTFSKENDPIIRDLLVKIESQIKAVIMNLIKHCQINSKNVKTKENHVSILKKLYARLLRNSKEDIQITNLITILVQNLKHLQNDYTAADWF